MHIWTLTCYIFAHVLQGVWRSKKCAKCKNGSWPGKNTAKQLKRKFLACGWYGALGRVANFEMSHLRSLGRVANFKNEACGNGGIGFWVFNMLRMLLYDHQGGWGWGVGGCINVLDEHFLYVTEDAHVAHAVVWSSGVGWGGWGGGGVY